MLIDKRDGGQMKHLLTSFDEINGIDEDDNRH